ncbi:hypothetical protein KR215_004332, partial [Drosophila sulfurigaster]
MQACSGCGLKFLILLCVFFALVMQTNCGRVIYYKDQNNSQSVAVNEGSQTSVEKSMLLAVNRAHCKHGYMYDHRNRCRRVS